MSIARLRADLESIAPARHAYSFDRVGLQVGDPGGACQRVAVSLDSSLAAIQFAHAQGCQALLCHHPIIWDPLAGLRETDARERAVMEAIRLGVTVIAAHTNWDTAPGGVNDALARRLGLTDVRPFGPPPDLAWLKAVVFAPVNAAEAVMQAMADAGAGVIGDYTECAFSAPGTGIFRPGAYANPVIGEPGRREEVEEVRIEMRLEAPDRSAVEAALRSAHPYEGPAYDFVPLVGSAGRQAGRVGRAPEPIAPSKLAAWLDERLMTKSLAWIAHPDRPIESIAVVGGAADGEWRAAQAEGADLFVTGEVRQNVAVEASESGLAIAACGHYATEQPGMEAMAQRLREMGWDAALFEPSPGQAGRPMD
jgi:dinuclear metal center YbgI/SA1388 family protein